MIVTTRNAILLCALAGTVLLSAGAGYAQSNATDGFLEKMTGRWTMEGTVKGNPAHHVVTGEWMSNRKFVHLHEKTADTAPASERRYDADWFVGYDEVSDRYVVHLMDVYGARFSETLGMACETETSFRWSSSILTAPFTTPCAGLRRTIPGNGCWNRKMPRGSGRRLPT